MLCEQQLSTKAATRPVPKGQRKPHWWTTIKLSLPVLLCIKPSHKAAAAVRDPGMVWECQQALDTALEGWKPHKNIKHIVTTPNAWNGKEEKGIYWFIYTHITASLSQMSCLWILFNFTIYLCGLDMYTYMPLTLLSIYFIWVLNITNITVVYKYAQEGNNYRHHKVKMTKKP